jgi:ATP synthase protein I
VAERRPTQPASAQEAFSRTVGAQEKRKLKASQTRLHVWSGLGMLGLVGWSIGVPTLLGTFIGLWLDKRHPGTRSWTLALLFAGLCIGCANVWHWITKEQQAIHGEDNDNHVEGEK